MTAGEILDQYRESVQELECETVMNGLGLEYEHGSANGEKYSQILLISILQSSTSAYIAPLSCFLSGLKNACTMCKATTVAVLIINDQTWD